MTSEAEIIGQFKSITSADDRTSRFFLDSSNWSVEKAVQSFYDLGGEIPAEMPTSPSTLAPQPSTPTSSYANSSYRPGPSPLRSTGGVFGFSDLAANNEEGQNYFTGGKESGMMVQDPTKSPGGNLVSSLFSKAMNSQDNYPEEKEPDYGSGYRLGQSARDSEKIGRKSEPTEKNITITFWRQGFCINDGELRRYDDPENNEFLEQINNGRAPMELAKPGERINVSLMDKKNEDYVPPPKVLKPFSGQGQVLGSTSSTPVTSSISNAVPISSESFTLDETQPITVYKLDYMMGQEWWGNSITATQLEIYMLLFLRNKEVLGISNYKRHTQ
eukprot:CAMPEP_0174254932 /NCGR_PEP_ID=MMETSP0439-20130205/4272_1 /TAXON_ID=0 /ORGANISM="Stereomyxa ramosa, Strain Chinc5" /LENGTH=329 /DNA_ID=CAMNT_0015336835 /DNA_START=8 /DNA_END=998 /DNA_ORIENTATION=-